MDDTWAARLIVLTGRGRGGIAMTTLPEVSRWILAPILRKGCPCHQLCLSQGDAAGGVDRDLQASVLVVVLDGFVVDLLHGSMRREGLDIAGGALRSN